MGNHWVLAAIDIMAKQFIYFDPLRGSDTCFVLRALQMLLEDEIRDSGKPLDDSKDWEIIENPKYAPRQLDGRSCGVFVLYIAYYLETGN